MPVGKRFQPGVSGNPGGRPPLAREIKDLARQYSPDAIATLVEIMGARKNSASARVSAATELLNRGLGRPAQADSLEDPFAETSPETWKLLRIAYDMAHAQREEGEAEPAACAPTRARTHGDSPE